MLRLALSLVVFPLLVLPVLAIAKEPQPTNTDKERLSPVTVVQAKEVMGYGKFAKMSFVTGKKFRFTIVDASFGGLDAWLDTHPEWKKKVTYVSLRKEEAKAKGSHGFDVFRVATQVMPKADFLLIETGDHFGQFKQILETMKKRGSYFATMSLGKKVYLGGQSPDIISDRLKLLEEYQFTFLKSSGNYRQNSHKFRYMDQDGDRKLEFLENRIGEKGHLAEINVIAVKKGQPVFLSLGWQEWDDVEAIFELQLIKDDGSVVASQSNGTKTTAVTALVYKPKEDGYLGIRVIDKTSGKPAKKQFLGLIVSGAGTGDGFFNGTDSLNAFSQFESPFLISVGSFGLDKAGQPAPSKFSSIGRTNSGEVAPQVIGPGQLKMDDGEVLNGTSFSTPFIAAMYSVFASYNIRDVIEMTTTQEYWRSGLARDEWGRWGIPQASKLFSNPCDKSNKVKNFKQTIEKETLIIEFDFSRNCMTGMDYYLHAFLYDGERYFPLHLPGSKQRLRGWVRKHSKNRHFYDEPVRIEIPFKWIPKSQFGKSVEMKLKISTLAQWDPIAVPLKEKFLFTLPPLLKEQPTSASLQK